MTRRKETAHTRQSITGKLREVLPTRSRMKRFILLPKNTPSKVASKDKHIPCPASTTIQIIYFLFPIHTEQTDRLETWISFKNPNGLTERYALQNPRLQTHQKNRSHHTLFHHSK